MKNQYLVFANRGAIENNPILWFMYTIAFPFALFAKKIHLTPNLVTLLSFIFTFLAFLALIFDELFFFIPLWLIAYILDFVDGTLARMTGQIETSALDLDHITDILKIVLIFLGFGMYFNNYIVWVLSFLSSTLYVFYTLLNHELNWVYKISTLSKNSTQKFESHTNVINFNDRRLSIRNRLRICFKKKPISKKIVLILLTTITTIHAHTLLIIFFISLDLYLAYILMVYFIMVICYQTISRVKRLKNMKRVNSLEEG